MITNNKLETEKAAKYLSVTVGTLAVWRSTKRPVLPYYKTVIFLHINDQGSIELTDLNIGICVFDIFFLWRSKEMSES